MKKVHKDVNVGDKYGDWEVLSRGNNKLVKDGKRGEVLKKTWLCKCKCGYCNETTREVLDDNLRKGQSKGCGIKSKILNGKNNKKYNTYNLVGEYGIGYTSNEEEFYFDLEDYDKIKDYCWHKHKDGYLRTRIDVVDGKNKYILMHNLIIGFLDKTCKYNVDHINNKPNDNRKENLRICLHKDNMKNVKLNSRNKSGFKGVYYSKTENKWKAYITVDGNQIHLGTFKNKEDAIKIRKDNEIKYFGEYSREYRNEVVS